MPMAGKKKNKEKPKVAEGRLYVTATFNNTVVTITDDKGKVLDWTSTGRVGFSGTRKSTPFAATTVLEDSLRRALNLGMKRIKVFIKGPGPGRDATLRVLRAERALDVLLIADVTPIPHNGPRPPKRRRA